MSFGSSECSNGESTSAAARGSHGVRPLASSVSPSGIACGVSPARDEYRAQSVIDDSRCRGVQDSVQAAVTVRAVDGGQHERLAWRTVEAYQNAMRVHAGDRVAGSVG